MKAKHCDECCFFRDNVAMEHKSARGVICSLGHRPRFYMPHEFDFIGAAGNWGWKRRCGDFRPLQKASA